MSLLLDRDSIKNTVRDAADIVQVIGEHVNLKRAGTRFTGLCPFHSEKTPSFTVNPQGQFFHCFGCGEHGDVFSFVMKQHHMEFPEALKILAQKYGIDIAERQLSEAEQIQLRRREQLYAANEAAVAVYQQALRHPKLGKLARTYLDQRGVPAEIIERYRLGYAPDPEQAGWAYLTEQIQGQGISIESLEKSGLAVKKERGGHYDRFRSRIMFPIIDMTGRVVAFGGRIIGEGTPKYMNSPESPIFDKSRLLFGLHPHREAIRKQRRALVVEGNFDLLLLAVHGIDNVVAPLGTALTRQHIHSLRSYSNEAVLLFDADAAGLKAAMRSIPFFLAEQLEGRVALLPAGHDPDSYVRAEGPVALTSLVEAARPLAEFAFESLVREHGLSLAGKNNIVSELKLLLKDAVDPEQRALMVSHFSEKLGVSPGYFFIGKTEARPVPVSSSTETQERASSEQSLAQLPRQEKQLIDFLILHPGYFRELKAAGLTQIIQQPAVVRFFQLLEQLPESGACQPERLLDISADEQDRAYIIQTLMRGIPQEVDQTSVQGRQMFDELMQWFVVLQHKKAIHDLQEKISQAERLGDTPLLMELLLLKQKIIQGEEKKIE